MTAACPPIERIAAAASGEDTDAQLLAHAADCTRCRHFLDDQRDLRALARRAPMVTLSASHRELLAAEVMARADLVPAAPRRRVVSVVVALGFAAAAALLSYVVLADDRPAPTPVPAPVATRPAPIVTPLPDPVPAIVVAPEPTLPAPTARPRLPTAMLAGAADYAHESTGERDVVRLAGGELTVDALDARPVQVITGDTSIAVRRARIKVVATRGVIAQVSVFAGSAEVTVGGKRIVIEAGLTWERPATSDAAIAAFQLGWAALREGRNADAVAAFDRADDPAVAEDALYWSAIASERAKDPAGALERYRALLARFPTATRADEARAAIGRLAP